MGGGGSCLAGRFAMWSLAIGGQAGVERMLAILRADLVRPVRLIGCTSVDELGRRWLS